MSVGRRRAGSAILGGMATGRDLPEVTPEEQPTAGNWSRQAMRGMQDRLESAKKEAALANEAVYEGILEGVVPIRIPATSIEDKVGSDRIAPAPEDDESEDSFRALLENIRRRGLRMPLRVRAADPDWRPNPAFPRDVSGQRFALQSGRRRLRACIELGIEPLCFLTFPEASGARLDDLQERFFENTIRRDLTMFERLYSIGLIAQETTGVTQQQIAEIIGVPRATVSRGLAAVEFHAALGEVLDLGQASRDQIDAALKQIRDQGPSTTKEAVRSRARRAKAAGTLPWRRKDCGIGQVKLKEKPDGMRVLTLESADLDDDRLAKLLRAIERL
ncbi:ParB N-terminal domain-containing protein [Poseidonocella sp. HB161398]|uniref:ParB/RepB/Spo0J family partition protein n=1 Tax=Poseidonocella sp. HB161398 TaxID=2320855 RepID=UPI0011082F3F|nr:ParB N-terminal domain-containing protein [Poseidonocella sp. HB161398]